MFALKQLFLKYYELIIDLVTIVLLFALPYYLFNGKLFVGGDDTRLLYAYPIEYFKSMSFFSWTTISSIGYFNPNHYSFPFVAIWSFIFWLLKSRIVVDYLAFSLPLILGFIYFKRLISELVSKPNYIEPYVGALFYIFSPIMIVNQLSVFLMSAWLIPLIPFLFWTFIKFVKTNQWKYIVYAMTMSIFLSLGLYSIPWILGLFIPLVLTLFVGTFIFPRRIITIFAKRAILFFSFLLVSQAFWILPFLTTFLIKGGNNLGDLFNIASTFRTTVIQTATGNILYPLLNLPHRQLTFDYQWPLRNIFLSFYDKTFFLNTIFVAVVFGGIIYWEKKLNSTEKRIYLFFLVAFILSLFFFTVNIGPLKEVFLMLGHLPGFFMFRNFYDKFAPGYVFIYAVFFTLSLIIVNKQFSPLKFLITGITFLVIVTNTLPIEQIINAPLWTTKSIHKNVNISQEYLDFISKVKQTIDPTTNILNVPLNIAGYAIIKEDNSNNIFAGTSPFKFFTGINDFSGELSFPPSESGKMWQYIANSDYEKLSNMLYTYNVGAIIFTKNIPNEVKHSYLFFGGSRLQNQDQTMINNLTDQKVLVSKNDNFELYTMKKTNTAIQIPEGFFQRINPTKYRVYIKNLQFPEKLQFLESYHNGWKVFIEKYNAALQCQNGIKRSDNVIECAPKDTLYEGDELSYFLRTANFNNIHHHNSNYSNEWIINPNIIRKQYDASFYKVNTNGSIDVLLTIYFTPQLNFYLGILISIFSFIGLIISMFIVRRHKT